jgi:ABC-type transporter Mla MlaB component
MSFPSPGGPQYVTTTFAVSGTVTRGDIPGLCVDLAERLRGRGVGVVICDITGVARPDLATVEALARLRLTARRHGWTLVVQGADPGLLGLINLVGLDAALPRLDGQEPDR